MWAVSTISRSGEPARSKRQEIQQQDRNERGWLKHYPHSTGLLFCFYPQTSRLSNGKHDVLKAFNCFPFCQVEIFKSFKHERLCRLAHSLLELLGTTWEIYLLKMAMLWGSPGRMGRLCADALVDRPGWAPSRKPASLMGSLNIQRIWAFRWRQPQSIDLILYSNSWKNVIICFTWSRAFPVTFILSICQFVYKTLVSIFFCHIHC